MPPLLRGSIFALLGAALFAVAVAAAWAVADRYPEYPGVSLRYDALEARAADVRAIVAGNSHALAIDFDALGVDGFYLWEPNGDLFETRYLLERIAPTLPNLERVLLPVSYFLFHTDNARDEQMRVNRVRLYTLLPDRRPIPGDLSNFGRALVRPLLRRDHWRTPLFGLLGRNEELAPVDSLGRVAGWHLQRRPPSNARLREETGRRVASQLLRIDRAAVRSDLETATRREAERLLDALTRRGVRVVLYEAPYYHTYVDAFPEAYRNRSAQLARDLAERYEGVVYLPLPTDSDLTRDPALFLNVDHTNEAGARAFSRLLRARLEALGVLPVSPR